MLEAAGSLIETQPLSISASQEPTVSNRVCWLEMLLSHNHLFLNFFFNSFIDHYTCYIQQIKQPRKKNEIYVQSDLK